MKWDLSHIEKLKAEGKIKGFAVQDKPAVKRSKYGSKKTDVDGIIFHSEKEAKYYKSLKLMLKAGLIGMLEMQVPFELNEGGSHSLKYYADFVYTDARTGEKVICDVKGYRTREYIRKRRLMKKLFGITIKEV